MSVDNRWDNLRDLTPQIDWSRAGDSEHFVQMYEDDAHLQEAVVGFLAAGLTMDDAAIIVASDAHREGIERRLAAEGVDLGAARASGRYVALDAAQTLATFMVGGAPDEERFAEVVGKIIDGIGVNGERQNGREGRPRRVRVFGEMVALLVAEGNGGAALQLERLWNQLAEARRFALFCAYPMSGFGNDGQSALYHHVCAEHAKVIPAESYTCLANPDERLRAIARLQQKAAALEAEIAERTRLEEELKLKLDQLAEADRRKDEFLATLAHELRNPLAPIKMAARMVRSRPGSDDSNRQLDVIERQADNLGRLIDDLLEVARITQGKIGLRKERVELATIVSRAVDATRALMEQHRHVAAVTLPMQPVQLLVDPVRLEQILVNLLSNAAKYTSSGGRIWLVVERAGDAVELRVRDTGAGIAPEMLEGVFDLFRQVDRSLDRAQGGLGLGLTIARRLVEMHGGTIHATSDGPGRGAEFIVRLPASAALELVPPARPAPSARACAPDQPLRIMIVDDNIDAAEILAEMLGDEGYDVRTAFDGRKALLVAGEFRPQLVLLDLGLPEMDGYEVARRLRADDTEIELVALTGYGQARDRRLTAEAGFSGHLVKPVQIEALMRTLTETETAIRANQGQRRATAAD